MNGERKSEQPGRWRESSAENGPSEEVSISVVMEMVERSDFHCMGIAGGKAGNIGQREKEFVEHFMHGSSPWSLNRLNKQDTLE